MRKFETYQAQGWAPADWAHHPTEIKAEIRRLGWRPKIKECFMNSQRFLLGVSPEMGLVYCEGYAEMMISQARYPLEHGWLLYRGAVLDLTLGPDRAIEYGRHAVYTAEEVLDNVLLTDSYRVIDQVAVFHCHPSYKQLSQLVVQP